MIPDIGRRKMSWQPRYLSYDRRRAALELAYKGKASATRISDVVLLVFVAGLVGLLIARGADHVSFLPGLLVGMTLIQLYFHQFSAPLAPHEAPDPPASPIKIMSYAIQAKPSRPWKELIVIGRLLIRSLYGIARIAIQALASRAKESGPLRSPRKPADRAATALGYARRRSMEGAIQYGGRLTCDFSALDPA
jgi:hypothetical protein